MYCSPPSITERHQSDVGWIWLELDRGCGVAVLLPSQDEIKGIFFLIWLFSRTLCSLFYPNLFFKVLKNCLRLKKSHSGFSRGRSSSPTLWEPTCFSRHMLNTLLTCFWKPAWVKAQRTRGETRTWVIDYYYSLNYSWSLHSRVIRTPSELCLRRRCHHHHQRSQYNTSTQ